MKLKTRATIADLYAIEGKAEIVDGEIVHMSATGWAPHFAVMEIFVSLRSYVRRSKLGKAVGDNAAFRVQLPHRESFSPDAFYYVGPNAGMEFFEGAPRFAVEVRSAGDYGPAEELEIAAKRLDYFAAGTLAVWDVELLSPNVVRCYRLDAPDQPTMFRRGENRQRRTCRSGWTMPVDDLFES